MADTSATATAAVGRARRAPAPTILRASKAETLAALRALPGCAVVPPLVHFSVHQWRSARDRVLRELLLALHGDRLAVRSSAHDEDRAGASRAGHYRSHLDVPRDAAALAAAIDDVIASYRGGGTDRVLVQEMARDAAACGVLLTRDPAGGGPYHVLEYEEGAATDTVTRGSSLPRRVAVHRDVAPADVPDARLRRVIALARRIERRARRSALEIELTEGRDGTLSVLQVRALDGEASSRALDGPVAAILDDVTTALAARAAPRPGLLGSGTILGQMPDWNPAELIGAFPAPLAASVFGELIGDDVWQRARAAMGYRAVPDTRLVSILAGRPWVDVRASFNSFLPAGLDAASGAALVDAWLARLHRRPELHDKVELAVADTVRDFAFTERRAGAQAQLTAAGRARWLAALGELTAAAVGVAPQSSLARALAVVERLGRAPIPAAPQGRARRRALQLLDACRRGGTLPFAVIARHAFIGEALLRSAVVRGALRPERLEELRAARRTVTSALARDFVATLAGVRSRESFLTRYGHLRPGSFDVTSPRWDARPELFDAALRACDARHGARRPFRLTAGEEHALARLAREAGLRVDGAGVVSYASLAAAGRERAKLLLTRHLSAALELLAAWARRHGLCREDLARLTLAEIRRAPDHVGARDLRELQQRIAQRRADEPALRAVRLGPLLRDARDLRIVHDAAHAPTFVTTRVSSGRPLFADRHGRMPEAPAGRVVCIESADPGFDWIFAHPIAGLVTRFGGGNSHMAIRCFEHRVPAAIGVGEVAFDRLRTAPLVELRCHDRLVRCLGPRASA